MRSMHIFNTQIQNFIFLRQENHTSPHVELFFSCVACNQTCWRNCTPVRQLCESVGDMTSGSSSARKCQIPFAVFLFIYLQEWRKLALMIAPFVCC